MHYIELCATVLGFFCTWFSLRQHRLTWPLGIVSVALYAILFSQTRLYADMSLQVIYLILFAYGWYQWCYGGEQHDGVSISHIGGRQIMTLTVIGLLGCVLLAFFLAHYTNSQLIFWDTGTTVLSLIAQYLLAKKIIETWYLWLVADATYVGIYIYKHLYMTASLYAFYTLLAGLGYYWWWQSMNEAKLVTQ